MNHKELYAWLVEDLWGSFGYNSPEEHARVILNFISKNLIEEFKNIRDRIMIAIREKYGKDAKGSEYLENLFKDELKKWEE